MQNTLLATRVLITQATEFMGPVLCEVFAAQGAEVVASTTSLAAPGAAGDVLQHAGRIDVMVVNLALKAPVTPAPEVTDEEWREVFAALVDPLPRLVRAATPAMIARRSGKVLVIGSASALRGMKRASTYSAARGAQLAYVQAVGVELARHNVQVNAIAQNFVQPQLFPPGGAGRPAIPGAPRPGGPAGAAGRGTGRRAVRRVPVQPRGGLLRGPGVPGVRRVGRAVTGRAPARWAGRGQRDRVG
jgi:2-keto-3-deoxy-L-fuconate dehydrogenase